MVVFALAMQRFPLTRYTFTHGAADNWIGANSSSSELCTISWGHTGQSLGPRFALQSPGSDDLHLQVPSVVPHAQLDVSESRRRQHLPADELPRPEALDELAQLPVGSQTIGGSQPATQAIK